MDESCVGKWVLIEKSQAMIELTMQLSFVAGIFLDLMLGTIKF